MGPKLKSESEKVTTKILLEIINKSLVFFTKNLVLDLVLKYFRVIFILFLNKNEHDPASADSINISAKM